MLLSLGASNIKNLRFTPFLESYLIFIKIKGFEKIILISEISVYIASRMKYDTNQNMIIFNTLYFDNIMSFI
jgi:hypothetical protein